MAIPDYQTLMLPVLKTINDKGIIGAKDLTLSVAESFHLSEEELNQLLPSGTQRVINNRVMWATVYLQKAGLIDRPSRGKYEITPLGKTAIDIRRYGKYSCH